MSRRIKEILFSVTGSRLLSKEAVLFDVLVGGANPVEVREKPLAEEVAFGQLTERGGTERFLELQRRIV